MNITTRNAAVAYIRAHILRKQASLQPGQVVEYERTPLGGILEEFIPLKGWGHELTSIIKEASEGIATVQSADETTDGKVRVTIVGI